MKKKYFVLLPDELSASYCADVLLESGLNIKDLQVISAKKHNLFGLENANLLVKTHLIMGLVWGLFWGALTGIGISSLIYIAPPPSMSFSMGHVFAYSITACMLIGVITALIIFSRSSKEFYDKHHFQIMRGQIMLIITTPYLQLRLIEELVERVAPFAVSGLVTD